MKEVDRLIESLAIHIREKVSSGKEYENEIAEKTEGSCRVDFRKSPNILVAIIIIQFN